MGNSDSKKDNKKGLMHVKVTLCVFSTPTSCIHITSSRDMFKLI